MTGAVKHGVRTAQPAPGESGHGDGALDNDALACVWMRGRRCATAEGSAPEAQGLEARQVGQDAAQGRAAFGRKPAEPAVVNADVSD